MKLIGDEHISPKIVKAVCEIALTGVRSSRYKFAICKFFPHITLSNLLHAGLGVRMTVGVMDAANRLSEISRRRLSNLQLQKILYMADMNLVGRDGIRLVDENFEAWDYGPVLPSLYHRCKAFGAKPVPNVFWDAKDISGTTENDMLALAWDRLRNSTPGQLVANTHSGDGAWVRRYVPGARDRKITTQDMISEYERLKNQVA